MFDFLSPSRKMDSNMNCREIRASFTDETIRVYQAYSTEIAADSGETGHLFR